MEKNRIVEFKVSEIKLLSYYEKDPSLLGIQTKKIKNSKVNITVNIDIHEDIGVIGIIVKAKFSYIVKDKLCDLFGIDALYSFKIKSFMQTFKKEENEKIKIPDSFMATLLTIAISGTRGMIAALNKIPAYSELILPAVNPLSIIKNMKENTSA